MSNYNNIYVGGERFKINDYYSVTTAKHINAFLQRFGLPTLSKKEIEKIADIWQGVREWD